MGTGLQERLRDDAARLSGQSIERGCCDSGLAANLAHEAADALDAAEARIAELDAECERAWNAYRIAHDQAMANGEAAVARSALKAGEG